MVTPDKCVHHVDHENRIKNLEGDMKEVQNKLGNPAVAVAVVGLVGTFLSGTMAFLGVVMAPVISKWLGL